MKASRFALAFLLLLGGCEKARQGTWLGYAAGDTAFVSAPLAGWVTDVKVERGAWVKRGDGLFVLDSTSQIAGRDQAEATIAQARGQLGQATANLELARKQLVRQRGLMRSGATSQQAVDQAQMSFDSANAQVAQIEANEQQARATLANASYQLSQRQIVSLTTGRVQDVYFRSGEYVPAMTPVISILPPENVYVRFFVPEDQFARIKLGRKVKIHCDGCADITATVSFIASQQEYTPPVIFSNQSRKQLVFKVEARAPGGLKLNPGQPVDVDPL